MGALLTILIGVVVVYYVWVLKAPTAVSRRRQKQLLMGVAAAVLLWVSLRGGAILGAAGAAILAIIARALPTIARLFESGQQDSTRGGPAPPPQKGGLSRMEALSVLDLPESATRQQIVDRYRQLMLKVHPDQGGSSYLAAQLNQAKKVLLKD